MVAFVVSFSTVSQLNETSQQNAEWQAAQAGHAQAFFLVICVTEDSLPLRPC